MWRNKDSKPMRRDVAATWQTASNGTVRYGARSTKKTDHDAMMGATATHGHAAQHERQDVISKHAAGKKASAVHTAPVTTRENTEDRTGAAVWRGSRNGGCTRQNETKH